MIKMRDTIKAFKALSDETRLRIMSILLERECCVCEVMQALNISQSRASRNLSVLLVAGFLKLRKDGLWSLYSLDDKYVDTYLNDLILVITRALKGNPLVTLDHKRLMTATRIGPGCEAKDGGCSQKKCIR